MKIKWVEVEGTRYGIADEQHAVIELNEVWTMASEYQSEIHVLCRYFASQGCRQGEIEVTHLRTPAVI